MFGFLLVVDGGGLLVGGLPTVVCWVLICCVRVRYLAALAFGVILIVLLNRCVGCVGGDKLLVRRSLLVAWFFSCVVTRVLGLRY